MDIRKFQAWVDNDSRVANVVLAEDFDRILAERDALQQRLNAV